MVRKGRIVIVDDDVLIVKMLSRALKNVGYEVATISKQESIVEQILEWQPDLLVLDINLGADCNGLDILQDLRERQIRFPVVMLTGDDSSESAIRALRYGAADYLNKPFRFEEVKIVIANLLSTARQLEQAAYLKRKEDEQQRTDFIGSAPEILKLVENAKKMARAGVPTILITGQSGTGKEVLARCIYQWRYGEQGDAPFIAVNCTALPENLIESELFGHVKGSFTDARSDEKGVFELANGGVLLLDEIGDMRPDLQGKLLRVLEQRTVRRLGGKVDIPVDVTVVACTNRDLEAQVEEGIFRNDLFYRLNSFAIRIPPLKERQEDILPLTWHFLQQFVRKYNKPPIKAISQEAQQLLLHYEWPGNVRELCNVIERCVVMEEIDELTATSLPMIPSTSKTADCYCSSQCDFVLPEAGIALEVVEKEMLRQAMERTGNNMTQAARLLCLSYDAFRYQLKKFKLV